MAWEKYGKNRTVKTISQTFLILMILSLSIGCSSDREKQRVELQIPRGFVSKLQLVDNGQLLHFGPFVGYYFAPLKGQNDLHKLQFLCFNEDSFYSSEMPENSLLFKGEAVFTRFPDVGRSLPSDNRINPVFFKNAPVEWINTRPSSVFLHFHSCYDAMGPVHAGYWVKHIAVDDFVYDMGGKVSFDSPLYHKVSKGIDDEFARIIEFDRGP